MSDADKNIIIAACNDAYCDSLLTMVRSISPAPCPVGILDLGLSALNRDRIAQACPNGCTIVDPGWCVDITDRQNTPDYKKVFLAKPFLPNIFPGYSKYLWIDADIWFQDSTALADFFSAADSTGIAVAYEDHPLYREAPGENTSLFHTCLGLRRESYKAKRLRQYFGRRAARRWRNTPTINSGIFCFSGNSPVWQYWQDAIRKANLAGQQKKRLICDQTCLDVALLSHKLPLTKMPPTHNWCLGLAQPELCGKTGLLLDPLPPHAVIKTLHFTGPEKSNAAVKQKINDTASRQAGHGDNISGPGDAH